MKNAILLLLILISNTIYSQNKNGIKDEVLYTKGETLMDAISSIYDYKNSIDVEIENEHINNILKEIEKDALNHFNELIEEYPNSKYLFMALYHKGNLEYRFNNYAISKETLIKVANFEKESSSFYKNRALRLLAWMAIEDKNYIQAIEFLNASKEQKVMYTCGTAYDIDKAQLENMYKIAESGLSEMKK
jgi:hypothetical protein